MEHGDDFIVDSLINENGKVSGQFISGELMHEHPSIEKSWEEGIKMGEYEIEGEKLAKAQTDSQQTSGYSDFWLG